MRERPAVLREHASELAEVAGDEAPLRKVLEDEVADEHVRDSVLHRVEPLAADRAEVDVRCRDPTPRELEHLAGHVNGHEPVEPLGEQAGHPPGAAADLDTGAAATVVAEPAEQAGELGPRRRRIADEVVDEVGGCGCVPGLPHTGVGHRQSVDE